MRLNLQPWAGQSMFPMVKTAPKDEVEGVGLGHKGGYTTTI